MRKENARTPRSTARPSGEYSVGCCDILIGYGEEGTLFRLFYPTEVNNINDHRDKWLCWDLGWMYNKTLTENFFPEFPRVAKLLSKCISKLFSRCEVPVLWEAPIANGKFPIFSFTHGLNTNRAMHSGICSDIASHGFIVTALEHKDGSANATFYLNENGEKVWIPYIGKALKLEDIALFWPKSLFKSRELIKLLNILEELNDGNSGKNLLPSNFDIASLKNKMDFNNVIVSGHSLSGATALLALTMDSRFRCGVILDPYLTPMAGIDDEEKRLCEKDMFYLRQLQLNTSKPPLIFLLTDSFQDKEMGEAFKFFDNEKTSVWTILNASHIYLTDVPMLFKSDPEYMRQCLSSNFKIPPDVCQRLLTSLVMNFIGKNTDYKEKNSEKYENFVKSNSEWIERGVVANSPSRKRDTLIIRVALPYPSFLTTPKKFLRAFATLCRDM